MQKNRAASESDARKYEETRNCELVVYRSGIDDLNQIKLRRLAVWRGVPIKRDSKSVQASTLRAECKAAWDLDKTYLGGRTAVPPPPPSGTPAKSYKSSDAYKTHKSSTVQSST